MKIKSKVFLLLFGFSLHQSFLFGHDQPVHFAITLNAAAAAYANSSAYVSFLSAIASDHILEPDATNAMAYGSWYEDNINVPGDAGKERSLNHFYDPLDVTYYKGLSDSPPDRRITVGTNSFAWASISNCIGYNFPGVTILDFGQNENTSNIWSWPNARGYEWLGLTATNQSLRKTNLLYMFRAVGQVMHLLEDTSQPQHVRNEQHLDKILIFNTPWRSPIEDWGLANLASLNYGDGSMLNWTNAGFTKLEDFWDRHLYAPGNEAVLDNAEIPGGKQLGLAEWCDANFIGDRHQYGEYYDHKDIRYYPYPSLYNSTDFKIKRLNWDIAARVTSLQNGVLIKRLYLDKTGAGVNFNDHSVLTYLGATFTRNSFTPVITTASTSIRDDGVLSNYHNVFIPKAVKYSAGLIDYFFRGTIDTSLGYDTNDMAYVFTNLNTSGQSFEGGTFYLFQQQTNGIRTFVQSNLLSSLVSSNILSPGASVIITNTAPFASTNSLYMVYQGTIGIDTNENALDPVDTNICIAACKVWDEQTIIYNNDFVDDIQGDVLTTNLQSDDFGFTPAAGNYEVTLNGGIFDDWGMIGGISAVSAPGCGFPAMFPTTPITIPTNQIAIVGNRLQVSITVTNNCPGYMGWMGVNITWRAWPSP